VKLHFAKAACALALAAAALPTWAEPATIPSIDYFDNSKTLRVELSPSGKYAAALVSQKGHRDRVAVIDLATQKITIAAALTADDVGNFQWISDDRLLFSGGDKHAANGEMMEAPGIYAINRDSSNFVELAARDYAIARQRRFPLPWNSFFFEQRSAQDSVWTYVEHWPVVDDKFTGYVLLKKINTVTGQWEWVPGPANAVSWLLDQRGTPRIVTASEESRHMPYLLDKDGQWEPLIGTTNGEDKIHVVPLAFATDDLLYVSSIVNDKRVVRTMSLATRRLSAPLVELVGYDFEGELQVRDGKLLGMRYTMEAETTMWFDPALKTLQAEIDALLPATVNLVTIPRQVQSRYVLVEAFSDRQPMAYLTYDRETRKLSKLGEQYPQINPATQATQQFVRYKARDGLEIPALLTIPHGAAKGPRPTVVMVHGGPFMRGSSWGWKPESQFLASRGYVVLEPNFRGSTGFGEQHFKAGWKQWGLKMQDDIADGARWLASKGIADAKRTCIAGGSYGGYSALMGVLNDPDVFKCAINWAGVTDIASMYDSHWFYSSDLPTEWKQHGMPELVGETKADAEQLKSTSPLQQAARIKRPLLLAYGDADRRVPLVHGIRFYKAVKQHNNEVEFVEYDGEGHGWKLVKNRVDFWGRVEKFLDKHIGAGAKSE
jgi:dipeptidyl aminopeptidase/acylaminoacyl peptidase